LTPLDKGVIKGFVEHRRAKSVGIARLAKNIFMSNVTDDDLGVPFVQAPKS